MQNISRKSMKWNNADMMTAEKEEFKEELISVIVPMYNVQLYVRRCLESIIHGSYQNLEILCIDDGSTDGTANVVEKMQEEDQRIRLIVQSNKGVSSARNRGLTEAKGVYIGFVDPDDWVSEDYYSVLYQIAKEKNADFVICDHQRIARYIPPSLLTESIYEIEPISEKDKIRGRIRGVCGGLYSKEICPFFNENLAIGEDQLFNLHVLSEVNPSKAWKCSKRMYYYFARRGSLTNTGGIDRYYNLSQGIINEMDSFPTKKYAVASAVRHALAYRYYCSYAENQKNELARSRRLMKQLTPLLLNCHSFSFKYRMMYIFAISTPHLYKWHRNNLIYQNKRDK